MWTNTFSQETSKGQKLASTKNILNLRECSFKQVASFYIFMFTKVLQNKKFIRGWLKL